MSADRMKEILKVFDIEMEIGGCGCCGSPWVTFKYKGETIVDQDNFCFNSISPNQATAPDAGNGGSFNQQ